MRLHEAESAFDNDRVLLRDFVDWWRDRAPTTGPGTNVFDDEKFWNHLTVTSIDQKNKYINCGWKINIVDETATRLPFRFGRVGGMRLHMPNLMTLWGAPIEASIFTVESGPSSSINHHLKSMVGCPQHAQHLAFEMLQPIENLATSLRSPIESIWIQTPEVLSFAGLNQTVVELSVVCPNQKSITGIHKQLRNVERLDLVLPGSFKGGLLGIAMIPGLHSVGGSTASDLTKSPVDKALDVINQGLKAKMNVHDIQEALIDRGFSQFARL